MLFAPRIGPRVGHVVACAAARVFTSLVGMGFLVPKYPRDLQCVAEASQGFNGGLYPPPYVHHRAPWLTTVTLALIYCFDMILVVGHYFEWELAVG